jgi:hypothetical protein
LRHFSSYTTLGEPVVETIVRRIEAPENSALARVEAADILSDREKGASLRTDGC